MSIFMLRKAWLWLKAYWYIPALLLAILFAFAFLRKTGASSKLIDVLIKRESAYTKSIKKFEEIEAAKSKKKDEIYQVYLKSLQTIKKDYDEKKQEVDDKTKDRIMEIIKETDGNTKKMSKKFADEFGIKYEERK